MNRIGLFVVGAVLVLMTTMSTLFVVDQRNFAVVYSLGEIREVVAEPGLKFKLPPPLQNVVFIDRRTQTLDSPETRPIFTAEKQSLVIDWLVKWRIVEPRQFIRNTGVDLRNAEARLSRLCAWVLMADHLGVDYGLRAGGRTVQPSQGEAHKRQCLEVLALC